MGASKDKGTRWETGIVRYWLREFGIKAWRKAPAGVEDEGDIGTNTFPDWTIQAKDQKTWRLRPWWRQVTAQRVLARTPFGVLFVKQVGTTDPAEGWAIQTIEQWTQRELRHNGIEARLKDAALWPRNPDT